MRLNSSQKASTEDRYKIAELLFEFQDLFKTSVKDIKQRNIKPSEIKLRSDRGAYMRQYKLTPDNAAEVEMQIDDMLKANVIEPAIGVEAQKYNTAVFLVPKRGETKSNSPNPPLTQAKRLVLDFWKCNSIIEPVILNLPPIAH